MRVLLVNDHPPGPAGGAEVHVGRLADALEHAGHLVRTVHAERPHLGWRRVLDLWDPAARRAVRRHVEEFEPDVMHLHNVTNELSTSVVGLPVPSVLTIHDPRILGTRFGPDEHRSPASPGVVLRAVKDRIARFRLRRGVQATIVPNAGLADRARAAGFPDVHVVENFTPVIPLGEPGVHVLYVGKLEAHKGLHVLLDAWGRIEARHPDTRLCVVGDGSTRSELGRHIDDAGLTSRVELVGRVEPDAVAEWLEVAAIVVVPSLGQENFPLVVLEAMAAGRPVVVSDWDGAADVVDDEVGAVVPAGDVDALAEVVDRLLTDHGLLERMGAAASARVGARWSPEAKVGRIVEIYGAVRR